jgi:hypothetical protein
MVNAPNCEVEVITNATLFGVMSHEMMCGKLSPQKIQLFIFF